MQLSSMQLRVAATHRRPASSRRRITPVKCCAPPSVGAAFNFSPASSRDQVVHGCHMPAFTSPQALPPSGGISEADMAAWGEFMRGKGVDEVVVLLYGDELPMYSRPPVDMYASVGIKAHSIPAKSPSASSKIFTVLEEAEASGRKVVMHCTGGNHRVGLVLTSWLSHRYGLDHAAAAAEMAAAAQAFNVTRTPPPQPRFEEFISGKGWQ